MLTEEISFMQNVKTQTDKLGNISKKENLDNGLNY